MNCSLCSVSGGDATNYRLVSFVQWPVSIGGNDGVWNRSGQFISSAPERFNLWTVRFNQKSWSSR
jgi:hypothetical protein